ncbi:MAG TPA: hypothetical protein VGZ71_03700 [Puia sp.]|jgi:hypothetical protein|nr:hypothetical protein [Puia sp.]
MQDFKTLDHDTLMDMLSDNTMKVSKLIADKSFDENYDKSKALVESLTEEIKLRKKTSGNTCANSDSNQF